MTLDLWPHEMGSVECDPMILAYPRDVIQYARSSYWCNNVVIIYPFCLFLHDYTRFTPKKKKKKKRAIISVSNLDVISGQRHRIGSIF